MGSNSFGSFGASDVGNAASVDVLPSVTMEEEPSFRPLPSSQSPLPQSSPVAVVFEGVAEGVDVGKTVVGPVGALVDVSMVENDVSASVGTAFRSPSNEISGGHRPRHCGAPEAG